MDADVKLTGPLFGGSWNRLVDDMVADVVEADGQATRTLVLANLDRTLKNPTGAYAARVTLDIHGTRARTHDQNAIYGPWLEGTGSRNATTRFKGYANWRRTAQEIERQVVQISDRVVARHVARLGG